MIYLDYSANFPVNKEVLDYMCEVELKYYGNYNSSHKLGLLSKQKYQEMDNHIKNILNLDDNHEIIYTSSATESNNLAILGIAESYSGFGKKILVSELEHSSINATLGYLKDKGYQIEFIKTLDSGLIDLIDLKEKLTKDTILVIVTLVDGETGIIQDYKNIASIISTNPNTHFLVDATQGVGKIDIDFNVIDLTSFTPHKFGGIIGSGCLIKKKSTVISPLFHGGMSNTIYRSGSVPLGIIASIEKALDLRFKNMEENNLKTKNINEYLLSKLKEMDNVIINSSNYPYIVNISLKNKLAKDSVNYLNEHDICISQKSACSIKNTPSKIIMAIYKDKKRALSSFRISLSELVTKEEIDEFIKVLKEL